MDDWLQGIWCWLGFHAWRPYRALTMDPRDVGQVCRHCYAERNTDQNYR